MDFAILLFWLLWEQPLLSQIVVCLYMALNMHGAVPSCKLTCGPDVTSLNNHRLTDPQNIGFLGGFNPFPLPKT